jgi:hypothetical protein
MQSISIQSLVGNLTIIVVFFVLSVNQNVITNSLNRSNNCALNSTRSAWRDFNSNICYVVLLCHEASHEI